MKKKWQLLFLAAMFTVPFVFGSCKKGDGGANGLSGVGTMPNDTVRTLTLDKSEVKDLTLGDSVVINADYTYSVGTELTWKSSDENILAVEAIDVMNCNVTAVNVGTATITATYGEFVATCTVTTSTNGIYPVLTFENEVETENGLNKLPNDKFDLSAYVNFNGKRYEDVQIVYTMEDASFGTVDQATGIVTLSDKLGTTTVTATATWRGIQSELLEKTVKINVTIPPVYEVTADGNALSVIELYTVTEFEGATLKKDATLSVSIKENNLSIDDYTVQIIDQVAGDNTDKEVVIWDETSGKITANTYGEAKLLISYVSADGDEVNRYYPIVVNCPQGEYETVKYFSTIKGVLPVEDIFSVGEKKIFRAVQGDRELTVNADGTAVTNVISTKHTEMCEETIVVYNNLVSYVVPLETYKMVIENEADYLGIFDTKETVSEDGKTSYSDTVASGYYFLKNDVIIEQWGKRADGKTTRNHRNLSFNGIFDGNGKTLTTKPLLGGTFGSLKGTVKNLNLDYDVVEDIGARETGKARAMLAQDGKGAVIENVNVRVLGETGVIDKTVSIFGEASGYASLKNVVIDYADTVSKELESFVVNSYWGLLFHYGKNVNTQNVYVISSTMKYLTVYPRDPYNPNNKFYTVAENDTGVTYPDLPMHVQAGVQRFDTWQALANVKNDLTGFSSDYWDITGGIPAWKEIKDEYVVGYVNGEASEEILLNSSAETPTTLVLSYGLINLPCELAFKDGETSSIATIDGNKITPVENAFGTGMVIASYQLNGITYEKEFALTVYLGQDETDTTVYTPWTGENIIWSTQETAVTIPAEMQEHGEVVMIYNQTDEVTVFFGEIWMTATLTNASNQLITKEVRVKFADGTGYVATLDCVTQALSNETELETLLTNGATIDGYYVLDNDITVESWATNHMNMTFNGVFDGRGHTVTMTDKINGGLFGILQGTVQNLGVVFNVTKNNIWSYEVSQASVIAQNAKNAVVDNLYVQINTAEGIALNQSFSVFGGMWDSYKYTSISNVVLDYTNAEVALDSSTYNTWGGYMFSESHNNNITNIAYANVYVISPSAYKYMHYDAKKSNCSVAENDAELIVPDGFTKYVLTGVKRYDSWDAFEKSNNLSGFDSAYWETADGKPVWKK